MVSYSELRSKTTFITRKHNNTTPVYTDGLGTCFSPTPFMTKVIPPPGISYINKSTHTPPTVLAQISWWRWRPTGNGPAFTRTPKNRRKRIVIKNTLPMLSMRLQVSLKHYDYTSNISWVIILCKVDKKESEKGESALWQQ